MSDGTDLTAGSMQAESSEREASGRFVKGQSGNPGGRAKMPAEVREMLTAKAKDAVQTCIDHLSNEDPRVALKAAELLLDRAYGKPTPASEPISFDLPDDVGNTDGLVALHAAMLRAAASGQLAISDARDMSALFEGHRRLIETADLEKRLAAIEAQQGMKP